MSRYDINRNVKIVLVRNAVDLSRLDYSCTPTTVHIWGALHKDPKGDFTAANVESLMKELSRLPEVRRLQVDLENWDIQRGEGVWMVAGKKRSKDPRADQRRGRTVSIAGESRTLVIDEPEDISQVLQDVNRKKNDDD